MCLLIFFGCAQSDGPTVESSTYDLMLRALLDHNVPEMSVPELADEPYRYTILDAREEAEYNVSHIESAVWVGYEDFDRERLKGVDLNEPIVVYCSVGYRSEKITDQLIYLGYTNVFNLYGGIFEWVNQGNPVYNNNGTETEKVHAYNRAWGAWLSEGEKVYE